ncbi:helix-turn-helix domain-containing protein [[Erwinia] mediterraneensis]|uniref:helix-turn-helix domain-containing protein n=1 Tax=[Erwinia] mediterraneensis TaxID=2161819 RepID=UPI001A93296E
MKSQNALSQFLLSHLHKIDPAEYGFSHAGRRINGLRREEVAQQAAVSVSWYTWLEQGRDSHIVLQPYNILVRC